MIAICAEHSCQGRLHARGLCNKHYLRQRRKENPELFRAYDRKRNQNPERKRQQLGNIQRWREQNPERSRAATRRWKEANPERCRAHTREFMRRWRKDPENQKRNREQAAAWRAENRECDRASSRNWRRSNPEQVAAQQRKKRAVKKGASGSGVTASQWRSVVRIFDDRCAYCGDEQASMDHMVPLSRGGDHDVLNVVPACWTCNSTKNAKTALEFVWARA